MQSLPPAPLVLEHLIVAPSTDERTESGERSFAPTDEAATPKLPEGVRCASLDAVAGLLGGWRMAAPLAAMCVASKAVSLDPAVHDVGASQRLSSEAAVFRPGSTSHDLGLAIARAVNGAADDLAAMVPALCRSRPRA